MKNGFSIMNQQMSWVRSGKSVLLSYVVEIQTPMKTYS
jgi:hypothetical protein